VLPQEEINLSDEDHLVGLLILFDSYLNIKFEFSVERAMKMIDLYFLSSGIKKQKLRGLVWDTCVRAISAPKRWDKYTVSQQMTGVESSFSKTSLDRFEEASTKYAEEIKIRIDLNTQRDNNRIGISKILVECISKYTIELKHDLLILNLFEKWIHF